MRVADYVVSKILESDVDKVFLVNGRGMLFLSDAIAKSGIDYVCTHHEQAAAFASVAYSYTSGKFGVCFVSTGCAATNALTAALCAYQDEIPLIFISGQNSLKETTRHSGINVRTFGQQEADIVKIVESITKYAVMVENPLEIGKILQKAITLATSGRKGPVWIDIPLDIQNARVELDSIKSSILQDENLQIENIKIDTTQIKLANDLLKVSKRPILLLGHGSKDYRSAVVEFAKTCGIPVCCEHSSVDVYGRGFYNSIGAIGSIGANRAGNIAVANADLILAVGARLDSTTIGEINSFAREAKVVLIDRDELEMQKLSGEKFNARIIGAIDEILSRLECGEYKEWLHQCLKYKRDFCAFDMSGSENGICLYTLAKYLDKALPKEVNFICDSGLEELIMPTSIAFGEGRLCIESFSQGCMGFALPASFGAYLGNGKMSVALIGDGSFMMNLQELQTIIHHKFPIKIIIANNNGYGVIRKRQKDLFKTRTIGNDESDGLSFPNFEYLASAFGIEYIKIDSESSLENGLNTLMAKPNAILCEIKTAQNQAYLHSGFFKSQSGKILKSPLEYQSPFLPKDVFLESMIIKPIL